MIFARRVAIVLAVLALPAYALSTSSPAPSIHSASPERLGAFLGPLVGTWDTGPDLETGVPEAIYQTRLAEEARIEAERVAAEAEAARIEAARQVQAQIHIGMPLLVQRVETAWPTSLQPCGGDLPSCCIVNRESHGDYNAQNPSSTASGKYQFLDSTWANFEGYARAVYAPPVVQDEKARQTWASHPSAWAPLC